MIIKLYKAAAKTNARTISVNAFLAGKSNSSAACGTTSNPTNAQGAIATIEMIAANVVLFDGKQGCIFDRPAPGCAPTKIVIKTTAITITDAKKNCIRPDKPVPLTLK